MSKKRPSTGPENLSKDTVECWRRRVFKNTFTRAGRKFTVDKWCVKIQHEGERRTISLKAVNKNEAAAEARQLYLRLLKEGWDGLSAGPGAATTVSEQRAGTKLNVQYWKQALIVRSGTS